MANKKNLVGRIDEIRANSVTPEDFEQMWGYSLDSHVDNMMDFIARVEAGEAPAEEKVVEDDKVLREAAAIVRKAVVRKPAARYSADRQSGSFADLTRRTKAIHMALKANAIDKEFLRSKLGEIKKALEQAVAEYAGSAKGFDLSNVIIKIGEGDQAVTIRGFGQAGLVMKDVRKGKAGRLKETDEAFLGRINLAALKGGRIELMQSGEGLPVMLVKGTKKGGKKM